jgi:hypothetical protein
LGLCTGAKSIAGPNLGSCQEAGRVYCGVEAMGPDGKKRNYGTTCREGQCGGGRYPGDDPARAGTAPSDMVANNIDPKEYWTDCVVEDDDY